MRFLFFIYFIFFSTFLIGQNKNSFLLDTKTITELADNPSNAHGKDVWGYTANNNEYALMGKGEDGLVVVDVTDPNDIELVSNPFIQGNNTIDIKTYSNYAYIANDNDDDIKIVSLINPQNPAIVGSIPREISGSYKIGQAHNLWIDDGVLYVAGYSRNPQYLADAELLIFKLKDSRETNPLFIGKFSMHVLDNGIKGTGLEDHNIHDVYVKDDRIYMAALEYGVVVADFVDQYLGNKLISRTIDTSPGNLWRMEYQFWRDTGSLIQGTDENFRKTHSVWITDDHDYLFTTDEGTLTSSNDTNEGAVLRAFDISNIESWSQYGNTITPIQYYDVAEGSSAGTIDGGIADRYPNNPPNSIHNVLINGDYAFISYYTKGLRVLNISNMQNWKEVSYYDTQQSYSSDGRWAGSFGTYPFLPSGTILLSDNDGLRTFNVTETPANFSLSGSVGQNPTLTWNPCTYPGVDGYKIYYKIDNGPYYLLITLDENVTSFTDNGVIIGNGKFDPLVYYKISSFNTSGDESDKSIPKGTQASGFNKSGNSSIETEGTPEDYKLLSAYPNPFNPYTRIRYELPEKSNVKLSVYNMLGQQITKLVDEYQEAGRYTVDFNANGLPSGTYIYQITAGQFIDKKKIVLVK